MLKGDAIPTIFPHHPPHLQKRPSTLRLPPKKRKVDEPLDNEVNNKKNDVKLSVRTTHTAYSKDHIKLLQEKIVPLEKARMESRSENKLLKEKLKRRDTKCGNLQQLEEQKFLSIEAADLLHMNFSDEILSPINNELQASASTTSKYHQYSEAVKEFSVTVHFYSSKAYDYLRGVLHVPHPSLIRQWAASMDCEPGFLKNVVDKLGQELTNKTDMRDVCHV
ncbi:THAP domain-containing protein 9 [Plakobranchus ocellatus]|uniref:THAP domain-containing protein 9 n=1 Tax=Plakobranchus ocellatus TaxID=259542 RepID=A0AAV4DEK6_9GAST|nr:THAP domain-containing protein 9 [Plakobranchus ocellatus]